MPARMPAAASSAAAEATARSRAPKVIERPRATIAGRPAPLLRTPSGAFVLARVDGPASAWNRELRARGVSPRPFARLPGAGECLRITIGPWSMLESFLGAFDDVRQSGNVRDE